MLYSIVLPQFLLSLCYQKIRPVQYNTKQYVYCIFQPCCPVLPGSCTVFNHQDSSVNKNTYRYHQSHSHRVPAYSQGTSIAAPSGENTCHLKLHMENYQPVSLSQQMRCFYSETPTMTRVLETLPSHTVIVNIILWPTVLFICGFVGMFFSCIKMQYDQGDQPQRTEQRSTAALL